MNGHRQEARNHNHGLVPPTTAWSPQPPRPAPPTKPTLFPPPLPCSAGIFWESDYGNPEAPAEWDIIKAWSPLHNVVAPTAGTRNYPAMLVSTAEFDDRVPPLHSLKYAATLQHVLAGRAGDPQKNALALRVETQAGHGGGKPMAKYIADSADKYAFCMKATGSPWTGPDPKLATQAAQLTRGTAAEDVVAAAAASMAAARGGAADPLA